MPKYHVTENGELKICNAKLGRCPYTEHFDSKDEGIKYLDEVNEKFAMVSVASKEFGVPESELMKLSKNELSILLKDSKSQSESSNATLDLSIDTSSNDINYSQLSPGEVLFDNITPEDLLSLTGTKKQAGKLTEAAVCIMEINRIKDVLDTRVFIADELSEEMYSKYSEIFKSAMPGSRQEMPVSLIWEDEQTIKGWTRDNSFHDIITISKSTGRVTYNEIKDLTKGAQISEIVLEHSESGLLVSEEKDFVVDAIRNQLSHYDPKESYTNRKIEISEEESLKYFIKMHTSQGCSKLSYKAKGEANPKTIFFKSSRPGFENCVEDDVEELKKHGISVNLVIRQNNKGRVKSVTDTDKSRFLTRYGSFFKSGVAKENFTIRDLDMRTVVFDSNSNNHLREDRWNLTGKEKAVLRIGEFIIEPKEIDEKMIFNIKDFKRIEPVLTGQISKKSQAV